MIHYTANSLNQYESRTVPSYAAVRGVSDFETLVTVNDLPAAQVPPFFHGGVEVDNTASPVQQPITVTASYPVPDGSSEPDLFTTETGSLFIPQDPELFTYDPDGNLLTDGRFSYSWDAENRLIQVESLPSTTLTNYPIRVDYTYDHRYRRTVKRVYTLDDQSHAWLPSETRHFLYDDWNLVKETTIALVAPSGSGGVHTTNTTHYTWGLDLSGSLRGLGSLILS